jgi:FkbM family methyltransferase
MIRYLTNNTKEFIKSCKKNSVTTTLAKIPPKLYDDLNKLPMIIRTNMKEKDGIYIFNDGEFQWALPHPNYDKYETVKNWDNLHDRYQEKLKNNDCFLKVGSATGEDLIQASKNIGKNGTIHAFEPSPANFACLKKNVRMYNMDCVVPQNVAASNDPKGEMDFLEHTSSHTTHRPLDILSSNDERNYSTTKVDKTTVDKYCKDRGINEIDMLSITVNRYEKNVLKGANYILEETNYVVLPALYEDTMMILEDAGFELVDESHKNTGCLFINKTI